MKNLCDPALAKYRIRHPMGEVPDELRAYAGAFVIPAGTAFNRGELRVIVSRGGDVWGAEAGARWDHVSVSRCDRCPTWQEMCLVKDMFFKPDEVAMQLHPVAEYINNHPFCLHLWRPLDAEIPLPPSILVGLPELNPRSAVA